MNDQNSNQPLTVVLETPSPKDQAVSALVGLGISFAATALFVGGIALATEIHSKIQEKRAAKKAAQEKTTDSE